MKTQLPAYNLGDGRIFSAVERYTGNVGQVYPLGLDSNEKIRSFMADLWDKTLKKIRPEHNRMTRLEHYYSGHPYENARDNFELEVSNYPASVVETVWADMVTSRPRPEIQAAAGDSTHVADMLNETATWMMNLQAFDQWNRLGTRSMLKYGWDPSIIVIDPKTGLPYPKNWNNWDYYPDLTASSDDEMMYYFLAGPVNTRYLRSLFPDKAHLIKPDRWVSPSYDALERVYEEMNGGGPEDRAPKLGTYAAYDRGFEVPSQEATPAGDLALTNPSGHRGSGDTTFFMQLFIRDLTSQPVTYLGQLHDQNLGAWHWNYMTFPETVCSGGWRVMQMTASGEVLDVSPLDECFAGRNVVVGRDYHQPHRLFCPGEQDWILSKVRSYNERQALLGNALKLQSMPITLVDTDSGIDPNKAGLIAGEMIHKKHGTSVEVVTIGGPTEAQFLMQDSLRNDINSISGAEDSFRGAREPGLRTGVAIQALQNAAGRRITAKEKGRFDVLASIVKKMMTTLGMKAQRRIMFRGTRGQQVTIDPEILLGEYGVRFAEGSGMASTRDSRKQEAFAYFQAGGIDLQAFLQTVEWPNWEEVAQRMQQQQMMEMLVRAKEAEAGGGPKNKQAA